ncbi:MAG: hypothetical protein NTNFB02_37370 [Nitrospira sp.]
MVLVTVMRNAEEVKCGGAGERGSGGAGERGSGGAGEMVIVAREA